MPYGSESFFFLSLPSLPTAHHFSLFRNRRQRHRRPDGQSPPDSHKLLDAQHPPKSHSRTVTTIITPVNTIALTTTITDNAPPDSVFQGRSLQKITSRLQSC